MRKLLSLWIALGADHRYAVACDPSKCTPTARERRMTETERSKDGGLTLNSGQLASGGGGQAR
jgi:hypothetical protein